MNPGRDLDALIAEKIFGINVNVSCPKYIGTEQCKTILGSISFTGICPNCGWSGYASAGVLHYSVNIGCAWEVVKKLRHIKRVFALRTLTVIKDNKNHWMACWEIFDPEYRSVIEYADTAPHAICLAALKAIEREKT